MGTFLYRAVVLVNAYKYAKFQLPSSNSFRDKEGVPKFNVGLLPPALPHTLKQLRMLQILSKIKQPAKFQRRISTHHAVMRICISHRLSMCPKNRILGVLRVTVCDNNNIVFVSACSFVLSVLSLFLTCVETV